jgi:hypothetical protein
VSEIALDAGYLKPEEFKGLISGFIHDLNTRDSQQGTHNVTRGKC